MLQVISNNAVEMEKKIKYNISLLEDFNIFNVGEELLLLVHIEVEKSKGNVEKMGKMLVLKTSRFSAKNRHLDPILLSTIFNKLPSSFNVLAFLNLIF